MPTTRRLTCPLCEATCGLVMTLDDSGDPKVVRGDRDHPLSRGFICPKGASLPAVHADPDRLRLPLAREGSELVEVSWEYAFERLDQLVGAFLSRHDRSALAAYTGNPSAHNLALMLYAPIAIRAMGTTNVYTSGSVDTQPLLAVHALLYGDSYAIPVPDIDRTQLFVILGGNPVVSNGSIMSVPDFRGRVDALRERGGRIVVVDPRRTETAEIADEHLPIRPTTDVWLLASILRHLLTTDGHDRQFTDAHASGIAELTRAVEPFTFERASARCGLPVEAIERLADAIATTPRTAVYGRMGTSTQQYGSVCLWLIACINVVSGHVDRPGGTMFPLSASLYRRPNTPHSELMGRWNSRVRGLPEVLGELPAATLAEDVVEPGPGQIRGAFTFAGNPALSVPDGGATVAALRQLELLICVDNYLNETTVHADLVFPGDSPLQRPHFPFLSRFGVRNVAQWTDPPLAPEPDRPREWHILLQIAATLQGRGIIDPVEEDERYFIDRLTSETRTERSSLFGRSIDELLAMHAGSTGPERLMDMRLRLGPYGDHYGAVPDGISVDRLRRQPEGVDFGPLQSRLGDVIATASGRIELWHDRLGAQLASASEQSAAEGMVLISRRSLRSNNSWMHNIAPLVRGKHRCTMEIHPDDAARLGLGDGDDALVEGVHETIRIPVEVTDAMRPGVVSTPHGWGHDAPGTRMATAATRPGVNSNLLGDPAHVDGLTATAVTNGIPVTVRPASSGE